MSDVSEAYHPEWQEVKQEEGEEFLHIKKEEQEEAITRSTGVPLKSEDVSQVHCPEQQQPPLIKEEHEEDLINVGSSHIDAQKQPSFLKKEKEELSYITKKKDINESSGEPLKREYEALSEASRRAEPPSGISTEGSHANGLRAPLSDCDNAESHLFYTDDDDDEQFVGHETDHSGIKRWRCSQCGKTYGSKSGLKRHLRSHTDNSQAHHPEWHESPLIKMEGEESPYVTKEEEVMVHMKEEERFIKVWKSDTEEHLQILCIKKEEEDITESIGEPVSEDEGPSECSGGPEPPSGSLTEGSYADGLIAPLSDSDDATPHLPSTDDDGGNKMGQSENKRWKCCQCGKDFVQKGHLKRHLQLHTGEKPYSCPVCGKSFTQKGDVTKHMRVHNGKKPFSCSECGQGFTQRGNLNTHTRIHTGEKPFSCIVCGQKFSVKQNLRMHLRIHTGDKPFSCSVCGQTFTQKAQLMSHMKSHTGEKPFICSDCGQRFTQKVGLDGHMRTHTGERPFSCSVCSQSFVWKYQVKRHVCLGMESTEH
ncbi:zinc finger protein 568-like isoform X2 [Corythoichthys intestinalis]|uniref:zinc finger protein 568-like isoform X2 n=1 Tax=Corythoichthys intestinalis TaxID=161448 RepID=UPI0025A4FCF8|nr:zinc finger protein 568-like isoform X2 [Corythoichthys intestinalis]